jgi:hypothetical protein
MPATSGPPASRWTRGWWGALLAVAAGYRSFGSVGPYRRDLGRFFSRLGDLAVRAGRQAAVSLRIGGVRVRARASDDRLRFDVEG